MPDMVPVFYDCEASGMEGYPIEVGWAFTDTQGAAVLSESHLIRPPEDWPIRETWDSAAARLHGITLSQLRLHGLPVEQIARRMNAVLDGRQLFSDALQDEAWLQLLFDAADMRPSFIVRRTDAMVLISRTASDRGMDEADYSRAKASADDLAPRRHRAEADARHLAVLWNIVTQFRVRS